MEELTEEEQKVIDDGHFVNALINSPGWKIIIKELAKQRQKLIDEIIKNIADWESFLMKKEQILAIDELIKLPQEIISEWRYLEEELLKKGKGGE